jgi:RNA polymerase sigma-70 factor (ECF subfamily)
MMTSDFTTPHFSNKSQTTSLERRAFETQLLDLLPALRAFALSLTRNNCNAEDLVQDTLMRALRAYDRFEPGSNMKSWTFMILHNRFLSGLREKKVEALDEIMERTLSLSPNQQDSLELKDVLGALDTLVPEHRDAIRLVRVAGFSYEEAAEIMSCKLGTIKSRVSRADAALRGALGPEFCGQYGGPRVQGTLNVVHASA